MRRSRAAATVVGGRSVAQPGQRITLGVWGSAVRIRPLRPRAVRAPLRLFRFFSREPHTTKTWMLVFASMTNGAWDHTAESHGGAARASRSPRHAPLGRASTSLAIPPPWSGGLTAGARAVQSGCPFPNDGGQEPMRKDPSARARVAAGVAVGLLALGAGAAQADYRATGEFAGFVCGSGGCEEARFDDATVPGNFRLEPGAVFAAVTGHDAEAGTCRIDLADPALAEAAASVEQPDPREVLQKFPRRPAGGRGHHPSVRLRRGVAAPSDPVPPVRAPPTGGRRVPFGTGRGSGGRGRPIRLRRRARDSAPSTRSRRRSRAHGTAARRG